MSITTYNKQKQLLQEVWKVHGPQNTALIGQLADAEYFIRDALANQYKIASFDSKLLEDAKYVAQTAILVWKTLQKMKNDGIDFVFLKLADVSDLYNHKSYEFWQSLLYNHKEFGLKVIIQVDSSEEQHKIEEKIRPFWWLFRWEVMEVPLLPLPHQEMKFEVEAFTDVSVHVVDT